MTLPNRCSERSQSAPQAFRLALLLALTDASAGMWLSACATSVSSPDVVADRAALHEPLNDDDGSDVVSQDAVAGHEATHLAPDSWAATGDVPTEQNQRIRSTLACRKLNCPPDTHCVLGPDDRPVCVYPRTLADPVECRSDADCTVLSERCCNPCGAPPGDPESGPVHMCRFKCMAALNGACPAIP
jgi:hypothetical protein